MIGKKSFKALLAFCLVAAATLAYAAVYEVSVGALGSPSSTTNHQRATSAVIATNALGIVVGPGDYINATYRDGFKSRIQIYSDSQGGIRWTEVEDSLQWPSHNAGGGGGEGGSTEGCNTIHILAHGHWELTTVKQGGEETNQQPQWVIDGYSEATMC